MKNLFFIIVLAFSNVACAMNELRENNSAIGRCLTEEDFRELERATLEHIQQDINRGITPLVVLDNGDVYPVGCVVGIDDPCSEQVSISFSSCYESSEGISQCHLEYLRKYSPSPNH